MNFFSEGPSICCHIRRRFGVDLVVGYPPQARRYVVGVEAELALGTTPKVGYIGLAEKPEGIVGEGSIVGFEELGDGI